jgi:hypothetical protein
LEAEQWRKKQNKWNSRGFKRNMKLMQTNLHMLLAALPSTFGNICHITQRLKHSISGVKLVKAPVRIQIIKRNINTGTMKEKDEY